MKRGVLVSKSTPELKCVQLWAPNNQSICGILKCTLIRKLNIQPKERWKRPVPFTFRVKKTV